MTQNHTFPSIRRFFMSFSEVEGKMKQIDLNNGVLESLIDNKITETIQEAVDQRMGPYMCDNSLEESKAEQNDFLNILRGFKRAAEEKRLGESMTLLKTHRESALQIEHAVSEAQSSLDLLSKKTQLIGQETSTLFSEPSNTAIRAFQQQRAHQIEAKMRENQVELEVCLLQEQINAVGGFNELKQLLRSL